MAKYTAEQIGMSREYFMDTSETARLLDAIERLSLGEIADLLSRGVRKDVDLEGGAAKMFNWLFRYFNPLDPAIIMRAAFPRYMAYAAELANLFLQESDEDVWAFGLDLFISEHTLSWRKKPIELEGALRSLPCTQKVIQKVFLWARGDKANERALMEALDYILSTLKPQP